jgi:hypothetical protein
VRQTIIVVRFAQEGESFVSSECHVGKSLATARKMRRSRSD